MVERDRTLDLVESAQRGDRGAFGELAELHRSRLLAFVRSRMGRGVRQVLEPEDVVAGLPLSGWALDPSSRTLRGGLNNRLVLVRLDVEQVSPETRGQVAAGVMAYSAICTHSGCTVSDWDAGQHALVCPCHESAFDPYDGGAVIGGPAPRALPWLGLGVNDGLLVVTAVFSSAPGSEPA